MKKYIKWIGFSVFTIGMGCLFVMTAEAKEKDRSYFEDKGQAIWEIPTSQKVIALTFDDGPSPKYTPQILEVLKQYDAKATFFVVGARVKEHPAIIKRQIAAGHELANHTYTHPNFRGLSRDGIKKELRKTNQALTKITGHSSHLFRPPGGYYNEDIMNLANQEGYTVVLWSWDQDTYDWKQPGVRYIVNKVLKHARNGEIILFHDYGGSRKQTIEALKQILPELKNRGYTFVTVSQLLKMDPRYKYLNQIGKKYH